MPDLHPHKCSLCGATGPEMPNHGATNPEVCSLAPEHVAEWLMDRNLRDIGRLQTILAAHGFELSIGTGLIQTEVIE